MIEYIVVLAFSVILLTKATDTEDAPIKQLADAIRGYHEHYTYAMAIAYIPECDYSTSLNALMAPFADSLKTDIPVMDSAIDQITSGISISGDRCIDWQSPSLPLPTISLESFIDMPTADQVGEYVKDIVTDMLEGALKQFLDPLNNIDDFTGGMFDFNIGDFF